MGACSLRIYWISLAFAVAFMSSLFPMPASAQGVDPITRAALTNLIQCYARGTDAIGNSTTNPNPGNAGEAIYRRCFTDSAIFRSWAPGTPFDQPAFPNSVTHPPDVEVVGPTPWATFVNESFRQRGFEFTQHVISNIEISRVGRNARLVAYLTANHVIPSTTPGSLSQCVVVLNGTYSMEAKLIDTVWIATSLSLTMITFNPVFETGAGCD